MITATQYIEKKAKGLVQILKIGKSHAMAVKKFDEEDGAELQAEVYAIDINNLKDQKVHMEKEVVNLEALIDDLEALE